MTLQTAILERARWWGSQKFRETSKNRGPGVDDVQIAFDGGLSREAYCAKFAWVVLDQACRMVGARNLLPKTAGARDMRNKARERGQVAVNATPVPGSVFYRYSSCSSCTGHIGIVYDTSRPSGMITVEGNHSDRIDFFTVPWKDITDTRNGFAFIHVEGATTSEAGFPWLGVALLTGAVATAYVRREEWA